MQSQGDDLALAFIWVPSWSPLTPSQPTPSAAWLVSGDLVSPHRAPAAHALACERRRGAAWRPIAPSSSGLPSSRSRRRHRFARRWTWKSSRRSWAFGMSSTRGASAMAFGPASTGRNARHRSRQRQPPAPVVAPACHRRRAGIECIASAAAKSASGLEPDPPSRALRCSSIRSRPSHFRSQRSSCIA